MLFSSLTFLFSFLPILLILYFSIKSIKIKNLILLVFSLVFYAWGEPKYIILMFLTVLIAYSFGLLIDKFDRKKKKTCKKISFIVGLILIIGNLVFFKYTNFIINNLNLILKNDFKFIDVVLPIGISFYTFQILSYIIDLYRKKIKVQKNYFDLMLYVAFFPQLIAGPIVRYETICSEIHKRKTTFNDIYEGTKRFIIGLGKKVIIANNMAVIADMIFDNYSQSFGTSIVWVGAIAYAFQIYYDFSGYSDMAIGLGRIFGFHFLENFNFPYIATSITDFWRRWHISLGSWFRDYVYIPLGGNRCKIWKFIRNILIVWCLTGLWHGASWNFVIWGLYYGLILLFEKKILLKILEKFPNFIRWIYTLLIVIVGWTIFRCNDLDSIIIYTKEMILYNKTDWSAILSNDFSIIINFIYFIPAILFSFPTIKNLEKKYSGKVWFNLLSNVILLLMLLICIVFLVSSTYNPFIYFRF